MVELLTDVGMTTATARQLADDPTISDDRIREKVEQLRWLQEQGGIQAPANPAGWLRKAIEED